MNDTIPDIKNGEELDKRIESLIDELSDLLQLKPKSNQKDIESNKLIECNETPNLNGLQTTLEAIAELLQRDDCDLYFETLYPLILNSKKILNLIFCITSEDSKFNNSGLTSSNVELNSIWETICYKIEKLITNDMIKNDLDQEFERICTQLRFLYQLKNNEMNKQFGGQGFDIWRLFDAIRVCKLESDAIELNEKQFDLFLKRIVLMINFELRLFKNGYFGSYGLTYSELIRPFIQLVKTRFESELLAINNNVNHLVKNVKNMMQFEDNLIEIKQQFPRLMESPELNELFEWKSFMEINININAFNKSIYNKINSDLKKLNCFKRNNFEKCFPLNDFNVFCCVSQVFQDFEDYGYLCVLEPFMTFLSYAISANILDFFIHHFNTGKYDSFDEKYTLLNSIHYILNKLGKLNINTEKFRIISDKLIRELKAKHVSIQMIANNIQYSVLYLNRLWLELDLKLNYLQQRHPIFEFVLSETIHHFSGSDLNRNEIIFLLNNTIDLLLKNSYSRKEFLFETRNNVHNSCWILFIKLILKITTNEDFISNLKQNNNLPENLDNNSTKDWIQFIRPKLNDNTFWFNAKLCVDKRFDEKQTKLIMRAYLSKNCSFSSYVLSNIDFNHTNEPLIAITEDIFQIILLQNFRPNLFAEVLLKLIERHNSWSDFDKSKIFDSGSSIWWYKAMESFITIDVDNHLVQNMKTLINDSLIASQVTQEIKELYKFNQLSYRDFDIVVEEGLQHLFSIINDLILTLPITLIVSLEALNQSTPEHVIPLAKSITLNVLVSIILRRLQNCHFLNHLNELKTVSLFCEKLSERFIESIESEKHFLKFKKTIESRQMQKCDSLSNEEIEFEIISASIGCDNQNINKTFKRLHKLLLQYKDVIDRNVCEVPLNSFDITLSNEKDLIFKFNALPNQDYDFQRILESIEWKSLENQIKLKFDYLSRLSLFKE